MRILQIKKKSWKLPSFFMQKYEDSVIFDRLEWNLKDIVRRSLQNLAIGIR